jgi:hypothetical protein
MVDIYVEHNKHSWVLFCKALIHGREQNKLTAQINVITFFFKQPFFHIDIFVLVGRGNAVRIATHYGQDGPRIEF